MSTYDWLALGVVAICLLLSAFFAGSETALTASSRARMHRLEKQGNRRAAVVNRLLQARERLIGALLLGNNAVNIAASSLATPMAAHNHEAFRMVDSPGVRRAARYMTRLSRHSSAAGNRALSSRRANRAVVINVSRVSR